MWTRRGNPTPGLALAALAALALALAPAPARADSLYLITFNTSAVAGKTGYLDFQFNPSDPSADPATATVSNYTPTNITLGAAQDTGGASGALPGVLSLNNSTPFNEVLQAVTFGAGTSGFSIVLDLGGKAVNNPTPGSLSGTSFGVGVLDTNFNPLYDSHDPVLLINLNGGSGTPQIAAAFNPPVTSITPISAAVPEPSVWALALAGLAAAGAGRLLRRKPAA